MDEHQQVPIWFFVGILLAIYGVIITLTGVYYFFEPAPETLKLANLHADFWWGLLLSVVGLIYCVKFRPKKRAA
jgi:hypothetical protein